MLILFGGGFMLTIGDLLIKRWIVSSSWGFYAAGMACWLMGLILLAASLKERSIAIASVVLVFSNVAILALVKRFVFGNALSWRQIGGLLLGTIAVALIDE